MSVRYKIYLAFAAVTLIPLVFAVALVFGVFESTVKNDIARELNNVADIQQERIQEVLERNSSVVDSELISIVNGFAAFYETGELLIATHAGEDEVRYIHERRYENEAVRKGRIVIGERANLPIVRALNGEEAFIEEAQDYRDVDVVAVTRYIPQADIGMVVKIDLDEAFAPVTAMRSIVVPILIVLFIVVFSIAWTIGRSISNPLVKLAQIAGRIATGEKDVEFPKQQMNAQDETGRLTKQLSAMYTELNAYNLSLEKQVRRRTAELEKEKVHVEAILASVGDALIVTDEEDQIYFANQVALELFGLRRDALEGKPIVEVVQLEDESGTVVDPEVWQGLLQKENAAATKNTDYFVTVHDEKRALQMTVSPITLAGQNIGAVFVFRNVTEEKEIDRIKTDFISIASHQLRTPLSSMGWFMEMLLNGEAGKLTKTQKDYIAEAYAGNKRMVALVSDLLNLSRLESGRMRIEPEDVDLSGFIESIVEEMLPIAQQRNCALILERPKKKIPTISLDASLLRQVVLNMVSNAVRYASQSKDSEVRVRMKVRNKRGQKYISIEVEDNGIGIPAEAQERVFEKFFRADNARVVEADGNGLGLYTARMIMQLVGGDISFASVEGKGTIFTVDISTAGMVQKEGEVGVDAKKEEAI